MNKRYRLVSTQNGSCPHVSSVVLNKQEIGEQLDAEAALHQLAGWTVTRGEEIVVCKRGDTTRVISVRSEGPLDASL